MLERLIHENLRRRKANVRSSREGISAHRLAIAAVPTVDRLGITWGQSVGYCLSGQDRVREGCALLFCKEYGLPSLQMRAGMLVVPGASKILTRTRQKDTT